jgi:hypothetical protein
MAKRHHKSERHEDGARYSDTGGLMKRSTGTYSETEGMGRYNSSDMINEDKSKTANLPSDVKMVAYPNSYGFTPNDVMDDTIRGIDEQQRGDHQNLMKQFKPRKGF